MAVNTVTLDQNSKIQVQSGAPGREFDPEQAAKTDCEAIE